MHFRRRLPHLHQIGAPIFITWRLHGSLPANRPFDTNLASGEAFVAMDRLLDHGRTGPLYLQRPAIAEIVAGAIEYGCGQMKWYELHAYVVMRNHVHLLITPGVSVSFITQSLKRYTARRANLRLGLTGQPFWQDESYDRLVRDAEEFRKIVNYIERNPVVAGLVRKGEDYPWLRVRPIGDRPAGCKPAPLEHAKTGE